MGRYVDLLLSKRLAYGAPAVQKPLAKEKVWLVCQLVALLCDTT